MARNVVSYRNSQDKAGSVVLNLLSFVWEMLRTARKDRVTIFKT